MWNSLRVRLLLALLMVVSVALGTMALYASRMTTSEFERTLTGIMRYRDPRIENKIVMIQKYVDQNKGERAIWEVMQRTLEQMGDSSRTRFVLADLDGYVYADSGRDLIGDYLNKDLSKPFAAFLIERKPILAYFEPLDAPNLQAIQDSFTQSVNRSLLLAILVAGLLTLLLTVAISQSILRPISALTSAAREMERGDLSQRVTVQAKDELGELARAFNAMADGLERLEQLRRNMVTDVAHELRTPLSNIRGYLEALQDDMVEPTPEMITSLHEEAMILNRLVDDLQELALVEAGQLRLVYQHVNMEEVVERAVNAISPQASAKGLSVEIAVPGDLPQVRADAERLVQVLRNLLTNAVAYTPHDGTIRIMAEQAGGELVIKVIDTGRGIAPEHLPYLFERFYRADRSRARATGGAGLGLAIVKQLVEAQGGQVDLESTPGQGTTVTFTVPVATPGDAVEEAQPTVKQAVIRPLEVTEHP